MATDTESVKNLSAFDAATYSTFLGKSDEGAVYYAGIASSKWSIGDVPHGGYVLSLISGAVLDLYSKRFQKDPIALNAFFLRKTEPGPFVVEITDLKTSTKGYCISKARLLQPKDIRNASPITNVAQIDKSKFVEKVHSVYTMGNMENEKGITNYHQPLQMPDLKKMEPFQARFMQEFVDCDLDKSCLPKTDENGNEIPGKPEFSQIVRFSDHRDMDFKALSYWSDMFATPPLMLGEVVLGGPVWCPTMQLELQFKRRPHGKELVTSVIVPHIINGRFDLDGGIWDLEGNLIAITRHQCLIVPWSRNSPKKTSRI